jgi:purine-nucleoside/S-methyl-5'-thioadenosine phosphorylase / adenosine deaminase
MIRLAALARAEGLDHGFFTRRGGVSGGIYAALNCGFGSADETEAVAANRGRAMARLDLAAAALVTCHQTHSTEVAVIDATPPAPPRADALVTARPGIALGILAADCAPVLLADSAAGLIGAAHAGWRGALGGVLDHTVAAMERLGARRETIVAAIGPCIGRRSYEVGPEFPAPFLDQDAANAAFFTATGTGGRFHFDLEGYVGARLARLGLGAIEAAQADTCADESRFFSYRRSRLNGEPDFGRLLSAIVLRG